MIARRDFLQWVAAAPVGLGAVRGLAACEGDAGRPQPGRDAAETSDATDATDADEVALEVDVSAEADTDVELTLEVTDDTLEIDDDTDAAPRVCTATTPDALGPYYRAGAPSIVDLAGSEPGTALAIAGQITDTDCAPLAGARIEVWQADAAGDYHDDRLRGTLVADAAGAFAFTTIMPGRYLQATGYRPAHLHLRLTAPGFRTVVTQIYFAGDPYLSPNDSCTACASDDPARILALASGPGGGLVGTCDLALARAA